MARATNALGTFRELSPEDQLLYRDHLIRLDAETRRDRFNGIADDAFIERYSARCFTGRTRLFAYVDGSGQIRGCAEIHPPSRTTPADIAFSVEPEFRRRGIASELFEAIIVAAGAQRIRTLRITSGAQNAAMRALARKFGASFTYDAGEATGLLSVPASSAKPRRFPADQVQRLTAA
ncbi:GNAT family N-acetyltransferase [Phreatobacter aquaticus]|uniref:GNAT family N-acetyltransferase n=1 Tax=Phreatobacter aquaticus TaxID=2570229 RepID=A0A4D7QCW4_9HYPH|nr:GNAT family N-acetyltransferase [Phreatobacter aquaticus]QCK84365.1 GNAT family N-acetyltransferase [Phreatobacter aquaticus]